MFGFDLSRGVVVAALLVVTSSADASPFEQQVRAKLEAAFNGPKGLLNLTGCLPQRSAGCVAPGFWFAFRNATESFTVALGSSNGKPVGAGGKPAAGTDIIPAGSLTKPFTAVSVLHLVDSGVVGLDDLIGPHVDPFLSRVNGSNTTLESLWNATAVGSTLGIRNVTVRMLLEMRGGLAEYDNSFVRKHTLDDPKWDISPLDYIALNSKTWEFPPDTKSSYNSIGYMLLAMLVANHAEQADGGPLTDWDQLDQLAAVIPAALRTDGGYKSTTFFTHGPCSNYSDVAHYFTRATTATSPYVDMHDKSCLNGWGFGNLGISAGDAASFFYDLLGPDSRIVSGRARLLMQQFRGWGTATEIVGQGHHYGLGLWTDATLTMPELVNVSVPGIFPYLSYVGHGGADYGTYMTSGWHPTLEFSFAFGQNLDIYNNASVGINTDNVMMCTSWRTLWEVLDLPGGAAAFNC